MINVYTQEFYKEYSQERFIADAWNFGCLDEDANGNNGVEFLLPEAKEAGFNSNLAYWSSKAFQENDNLKAAIHMFADLFSTSWLAYCRECYYEVNKLSNGNYQLIFVTYDR